jgi:hypothetical protein
MTSNLSFLFLTNPMNVEGQQIYTLAARLRANEWALELLLRALIG